MLDFDKKKAKKKEYQEKYRNSAKGKITQSRATAKRRASLEEDVDKFFNDWIYRVNARAKDRKLDCTLTEQDLRKKIEETNWTCSISKLPLTMRHKDRCKASVDRIDSSKGYTMDNIQIVAACVNMAKSDGTDKELIEMCKAIVKANP